MAISLVFAALPEFVIAILGVLLFSTAVFHVLPAIALVPPNAPVWQYPSSVVLPAAALVLAVGSLYQSHDARLDDRCAGVGLRADGTAEGTVGMAGHLAARSAERARSGRAGLRACSWPGWQAAW